MAKKNPFEKEVKQTADSEGSAEMQPALFEPEQESKRPSYQPEVVDAFNPLQKHTKEQAKAHIAEQFKLGKKVEVIALQDGEHPKAIWQKQGDKFKLQSAEAYSHRWMKLA